MKNTFLLIFTVTISISMSFGSSLNSKTNQLNTVEAEQFIKTPLAKSLSPIPEGLIKNLGFGLSRSVYSLKKSEFPNLNTIGINASSTYWGYTKYISFKYSKKLRLGFSWYNANRETSRLLSTETNRLKLNETNLKQILFYGSYLLYSEKNTKITGQFGVGVHKVTHKVNEINTATNENNIPEITQVYTGESYAYQVGLNASYMLSKIWEFGLGVNYTQANIKELNSLTQNKMPGTRFDSTGTQFYIYTGRTIF